VDINKIIIKVQSILTRIIGEDIDLKVSLAQKNLITNVDAVQVEQVLMNLATNARDAMPDGGELLISTEQVQLDIKGYGELVTCACIKVSDTGQGMNEYTRQRVFDPFFTTKGVGKGTGLGLAMAFGIVEQHEGHIDVDSEEGKGTTFSIYFPMAESYMRGTASKSAEQRIPSGRGETVLLVEDDESVRMVTNTILEQHGYSVLQAVDGEDALNKVAEYNDRIKLIILDVIMPKKSGGEVYDEIMKMGLNVKILFTSGYPADTITKRVALDTELHFIKKPTSSEELLRKIREVLDQ
jgi:CheY-like chemotaxis protein